MGKKEKRKAAGWGYALSCRDPRRTLRGLESWK